VNILATIDSTYNYSLTDSNVSAIGNLDYPPKILKHPIITRSAGSKFFGLSTVDTFTLDLINTDGYFDNLYSIFFNKTLELYAGFDNDSSSYMPIFSGIIRELNNNIKTITLTVYSKTILLEKSIGLTYYSVSTYADMNSDNEDRPIPQLWGENYGCPCVCLNELESPTPTNYTFKICDTSINSLTAVNEVYLNGAVVAYSNVSLADGTFTITAAALGTDNFNNVTADAENSISNAAAIIRDIIDNNVSMSYDASNYTDAVNNTYITSYYVDNPISIRNAINRIANDSNLDVYLDPNGLLYFKYFDLDQPVKKVIQTYEFSGDPVVSNNLNEYASSVLISYRPSRSTDDVLYKRIATYETQASAWYGDTREIPLNTNLTLLNDVVKKGNDYLYMSSIFRETIKRSIRLNIDDNIDLFDFVAGEPSQRDVNIDSGNYDVFRVLRVSDDYGLMTRTLDMQYIKNYAYVNNFFYLETENLEYVTDQNGSAIILGGY